MSGLSLLLVCFCVGPTSFFFFARSPPFISKVRSYAGRRANRPLKQKMGIQKQRRRDLELLNGTSTGSTLIGVPAYRVLSFQCSPSLPPPHPTLSLSFFLSIALPHRSATCCSQVEHVSCPVRAWQTMLLAGCRRCWCPMSIQAFSAALL